MDALSNGHFEHETVEGERWDLVAWRYYRDVTKQSVIVRANRHLFLDPVRPLPMVLPMGLRLKIPIVEERLDESLLPPWKRNQPRPGAGT